MDQETAKYIVTYFSGLLDRQERLAIHCIDSAIKSRAEKKELPYAARQIVKKSGWLTEDQEIIEVLNQDHDHFELRVAERIIKMHHDEVMLNNCPKCGKLARTPVAKQCRHCSHDWHNPSF